MAKQDIGGKKDNLQGTNEKLPLQWCHNLHISNSEIEELDSHALQKLEELAMKNSISDADADILIDILRDVQSEYITSTQEIRNTLLKLNMTPEHLSSNTQKQLKTASTFEDVGPIYGSHDDKLDKARIDHLESKIKNRIKGVAKFNKEVDGKVATLQLELDAANTASRDLLQKINDKEKENMEFYHMKEMEYKKRFSALQEKLTSIKVLDVRQYKSALETHEEIEATKIKVSMLTNKLEKYGKVPPNLIEAEKLLSESKQELKEITQKLRTVINKDLNY